MTLTALVASVLVLLSQVGSSKSNNITRSLVVAHDVPAGFGIERWGGGSALRLLDTAHSGRFAVVDDGLLMTTSSVDALLDVPQPVTLYLVEDSATRKSTHQVHIYVVERSRLLSFSRHVYRGRIAENVISGSVVSHLEDFALNDFAPGLELDVLGHSDAFRVQLVSNGSRFLQLVTLKALDRESLGVYDLVVRARAPAAGSASCRLVITVDDVNDNVPQWTRSEYHMSVSGANRQYDRVGRVRALDADGDGVVYRLVESAGSFVVVPQTGEILLVDPAVPLNRSFVLHVAAKERRAPARDAAETARIVITSQLDEERKDHVVVKRRAPRALRPTKRIEFTEADGTPEGKLMFQLEKSMNKERFKIRDDNPWVSVEPNGNVRIKRKWDYEELGPEKTIDFWVTITNTEGGGNYLISYSFFYNYFYV